MSMTNALENSWLLLLMQNSAAGALAGVGSGLREAVTAGNLYISLHTADPGEAGDQTTNEATYTDYARVAVARSAGGWDVVNNTSDNAALIGFPQAGTMVTPETLTHFGIGSDASGTGNLLMKGAIGDPPTIFAVDTAGLTSEVLIVPATALVGLDKATVYATELGTLPTGLVDGTVYEVATVPSVDTITLTGVNLTAVGVGIIARTLEIVVGTNTIPQFPAGNLQVVQD